jgi:hypothetical protein
LEVFLNSKNNFSLWRITYNLSSTSRTRSSCVPSELPTYIQQFGSVYQLSSLLHSYFDVLMCQAVEELKEKLKSLNALYTSQLQSMHNVVYAHEAISSSTLNALDNTVSAHPFALEEVYQLEPTQFQCLFL